MRVTLQCPAKEVCITHKAHFVAPLPLDRIRPVKLVRQGAEHKRGDGADDDKDWTGKNLVFDSLAIVEVFTRPKVLNPG